MFARGQRARLGQEWRRSSSQPASSGDSGDDRWDPVLRARGAARQARGRRRRGCSADLAPPTVCRRHRCTSAGRSPDGLRPYPWRQWRALPACLRWWCTCPPGEQGAGSQADRGPQGGCSRPHGRRSRVPPPPPPPQPAHAPTMPPHPDGRYHQYKFIVDGKWMHDETAPYMPDPLGNVNNWLFVRKIDPPAGQQPAGWVGHTAPAVQSHRAGCCAS